MTKLYNYLIPPIDHNPTKWDYRSSPQTSTDMVFFRIRGLCLLLWASTQFILWLYFTGVEYEVDFNSTSSKKFFTSTSPLFILRAWLLKGWVSL